MNDDVEALVGFVGAHGDELSLLDLQKSFDQRTPFVELGIERQGRGAPWVLRDDDLGATLVEVGDDGITVEGFVGDQSPKERPSMRAVRLTYRNDDRAGGRSA